MIGTRPVSRSVSVRNALAHAISAELDSPPEDSRSRTGGSSPAVSNVPATPTKCWASRTASTAVASGDATAVDAVREAQHFVGVAGTFDTAGRRLRPWPNRSVTDPPGDGRRQ